MQLTFGKELHNSRKFYSISQGGYANRGRSPVVKGKLQNKVVIIEHLSRITWQTASFPDME